MIRDRLHFRLVDRRGRRLVGEAGSGRNDPLLGGSRSSATGAALDAAGVDVLLRFALRQIVLDVNGALGGEVLTLLVRGGIADHDTRHETVNHKAEEYVRGDVSTNSIESAFGLFKRGIIGSFHRVSAKHMDRYLDEFEFRFNNRKNPYLFRDTLKRLVASEAMPYEKLTA